LFSNAITAPNLINLIILIIHANFWTNRRNKVAAFRSEFFAPVHLCAALPPPKRLTTPRNNTCDLLEKKMIAMEPSKGKIT
jgi:hypothetical protein